MADNFFADKTMNRAQLRACRGALKRTNDLGMGLLAARGRGWIAEAKKATTIQVTYRAVKAHVHPDKNDRALAMSLGVGPGPDTMHARLEPKDRNKKKRLRHALRQAGWVLG